MNDIYMPVGMTVNGEDPLVLLNKVKSLGMTSCQLCVLPIAVPPEKH